MTMGVNVDFLSFFLFFLQKFIQCDKFSATKKKCRHPSGSRVLCSEEKVNTFIRTNSRNETTWNNDHVNDVIITGTSSVLCVFHEFLLTLRLRVFNSHTYLPTIYLPTMIIHTFSLVIFCTLLYVSTVCVLGNKWDKVSLQRLLITLKRGIMHSYVLVDDEKTIRKVFYKHLTGINVYYVKLQKVM